jgi:hypothetical protein
MEGPAGADLLCVAGWRGLLGAAGRSGSAAGRPGAAGGEQARVGDRDARVSGREERAAAGLEAAAGRAGLRAGASQRRRPLERGRQIVNQRSSEAADGRKRFGPEEARESPISSILRLWYSICIF